VATNVMSKSAKLAYSPSFAVFAFQKSGIPHFQFEFNVNDLATSCKIWWTSV